MSKAYPIPFVESRENLGDSLDPRTMQHNLETLELCQRFFIMFDATREIDFLDSAIGLAQELSGKGAQPLLERLLELRGSVAGRNCLEQANMDSDPQNAAANRSFDVTGNMGEEVRTIQTLTSNIDSSIGLVQELSLSQDAAQPLLQSLLEVRGLVAGSNCAEQANTDSSQQLAAADWGLDVLGGMEKEVRTIQTLATTFEETGDIDYLDSAIGMTEELVAKVTPGLVATVTPEELIALVTPIWDKFRQYCLSLFTGFLRARSKRTGELEDIDKAVKWLEESVAATHPDRPDRARVLVNLATELTSRYQRTDSVKDLSYILRISYEAWHCRISPPEDRIDAARSAGLLLATRSMWQESSSLLGEAVKILPKVSSRSMGRGDQEHHLSSFTQLTSEAVAIAFKAGAEATHCLRLLEFGRGIITGLVIDCRSDSDLPELQSNQPKLFRKFHELRIEIDSPLKTDSDEFTYQQKLRRREEVVQELEETLNSIRKLSGFEGFQLPPRSDDLMAMAGEGPIVIFNSTEFRSDAIIVTSSAIKALVLPKLHYKSVEERMSQIGKLVRGRRSTYQWRNERMEEILLWLWDVAVEPVFDVLKLDTAAHHKLPRVWWVGMGLLAMAPFHAAGDHSPGSMRNTISRAISSYIPTMKALSYARQKKLELFSRPDSRLLLVSMPTTPAKKLTTSSEKPGKPPRPLKNATKEAKTIVDIVKGKAITTLLDCPSTAQVIAELPSCHVVHFACHGVSDGRNPSNSHLILRKDGGSELGTPDELTVGTISNTNIKQAQIAYLSACSSASLVDESIYIASGFQLAGFSHVLATQWISNDEACLQVSGDFYSSLFSGEPGGGEEGHQKVSASFHYAVKKLRDKNLKQPIKWACYIHTGA